MLYLVMNKNYKEDCKNLQTWVVGIIVIPLIIVLTQITIQTYRNYMLKSSIKFLESNHFKVKQLTLRRLNPEKHPCFFIKHNNSNGINDIEVWFHAIKDNKLVEGYICGYSFFIFKKIHIIP